MGLICFITSGALIMKFIVSCLWSNEILIYDDIKQKVIHRILIETRNEFDKLHSIRITPQGWLLSSTYTIYLIGPSLNETPKVWSHSRLSNVHSVDWLDYNKVVIANTGLDELIFAELESNGKINIYELYDFAKWLGVSKKLDVIDRRQYPRVKAENDHVHVNCATPCDIDGKRCLACCLFHLDCILIIDIESKSIIKKFEHLGDKIHSAWVKDQEIFVCSSAESKIKKYDLITNKLLWEWTAPGKSWVRSAKMINADEIIFTAERDRDNNDEEYMGYIGCLSISTGKLSWEFDLLDEGPFDIKPIPYKVSENLIDI